MATGIIGIIFFLAIAVVITALIAIRMTRRRDDD